MKRLIFIMTLSMLFAVLAATNSDRASPLFEHISNLSSNGMSRNVWLTSEQNTSNYEKKVNSNNNSRADENTQFAGCTELIDCTQNLCTWIDNCTSGFCTMSFCTSSQIECTMGELCIWTEMECTWIEGCTVGVPYCTGEGDCTQHIGCSPPTPVTLSTFTALYDNGTASLNWITQSESNNSGWNIYRGESDDSYEYGDVIQINHGLIAGAGTTSLPTEYNHTDEFDVVTNTTYWYMLESVDYSGMTNIYGPISLTVPQDEEDNPEPPSTSDFAVLYQNYPNPFNSNTDINFSIMEEGQVEISIYDVKGRKIVTLLNRNISANELVTVSWDGKDKSGMKLASGIYIFKLETNGEVFTKKMTLAK